MNALYLTVLLCLLCGIVTDSGSLIAYSLVAGVFLAPMYYILRTKK